jgi:3-methyl-2-oxobutanoate hydroxymethyltransferase
VKRFEDLAAKISGAAETYADEVRSRAFPGPDQSYAPRAGTVD